MIGGRDSEPEDQALSAALVQTVRVRPVEIPLAQPVELATGTLRTTPVVLIDLRTSDGVCGHSYLRSHSALALRGLATLIDELAGRLVGRPATPAALERAVPSPLRLLGMRGLVGAALAGLDMALWDARAQAAAEPLARLLGSDVDRVPAYATIRARDPGRAGEEAQGGRGGRVRGGQAQARGSVGCR
jgi:mandelate racemase